MSRTYKATGINLKSMPLGEADRLLTILTREQGLGSGGCARMSQTQIKIGWPQCFIRRQ